MLSITLYKHSCPGFYLNSGDFQLWDTGGYCQLKFINQGILYFVLNLRLCGFRFYLRSFY